MFDFPNAPTTGQVVTGAGGAAYAWDGTKWTSRSGAPIISDTPPSNPQPGALWWDSAGGQLYIYYNDGDSSQWVVANVGATDPSVAASLNNSGRNLVHNGQFNIAQRGVGPFNASVYTLDRWQMFLNGDTSGVSQIALNDSNRAAIGDDSAIYALYVNVVGVAGAANYTQIVHQIEGVRRLGGKTVTLSFWATTGTNLQVGVRISQNFGTGGSPTTANNTPPQTVTLTPTPTRYKMTFTLPSTAGTTTGSNNNDSTQLVFGLSAGANSSAVFGVGTQTGVVWFYGVQLEIGSIATPLARRDPADELALCQRFFCTTIAKMWGYGQTGVPIGLTVYWPVQMRATPIVAFNSQAYGNTSGIAAEGAWGTNATVFANVTTTGTAWFFAGVTASADL